MKVVLTASFRKKWLRRLGDRVPEADFCERLKRASLVALSVPYFKLRLTLGNVALRGVVLRTAGGNLVPLFLALKNEPEGRNVRWESYRGHILAWQDAALADIRAGAFVEA